MIVFSHATQARSHIEKISSGTRKKGGESLNLKTGQKKFWLMKNNIKNSRKIGNKQKNLSIPTARIDFHGRARIQNGAIVNDVSKLNENVSFFFLLWTE